jgi:hypothetical protein
MNDPESRVCSIPGRGSGLGREGPCMNDSHAPVPLHSAAGAAGALPRRPLEGLILSAKIYPAEREPMPLRRHERCGHEEPNGSSGTAGSHTQDKNRRSGEGGTPPGRPWPRARSPASPSAAQQHSQRGCVRWRRRTRRLVRLLFGTFARLSGFWSVCLFVCSLVCSFLCSVALLRLLCVLHGAKYCAAWSSVSLQYAW